MHLDSASPAAKLRPSRDPNLDTDPGRYGFVDKGFARKRQSKPPQK